MNRKASDQKRARVRRLLFCRLVALAAVAFFLLALQGSRSCVAPTLLVHVITCCRPDSLQRLLTSLVNAEYGVLRPIIDLNIEIDWGITRRALGGALENFRNNTNVHLAHTVRRPFEED